MDNTLVIYKLQDWLQRDEFVNRMFVDNQQAFMFPSSWINIIFQIDFTVRALLPVTTNFPASSGLELQLPQKFQKVW
jgi:hypothetical protein